MIELYRSGLTLRGVGELFGISDERVRQRLALCKFDRRIRSDYSAPKKPKPPWLPIHERLQKHVQKIDGHWIWTGAINKWGYARRGARRAQRDPQQYSQLAHKAMWQGLRGPVEELLKNQCGILHCVNPDHWKEITRSELWKEIGQLSVGKPRHRKDPVLDPTGTKRMWSEE